ncbi:MAG: TetR/AcrR family transcriptional regulator [Pseudomonadota bacterium]
MPRTQATPEQKEEARRVIRQAAADVYNSVGIGGVSVRAIAKKAGVSVGTIYTYFGSLQGLMESLWSGPVQRYIDQLSSIAEAHEDPVKRIEALMRSYVEFARENVEIYRGVFLFVRPLGQAIKDKTPAEEAVFASLVIAAIKDGQKRGQITAGDPTEITMMIWGSLHGCIALPHNFGRSDFGDTAPILERLIDTTIASIQTQ